MSRNIFDLILNTFLAFWGWQWLFIAVPDLPLQWYYIYFKVGVYGRTWFMSTFKSWTAHSSTSQSDIIDKSEWLILSPTLS